MVHSGPEMTPTVYENPHKYESTEDVIFYTLSGIKYVFFTTCLNILSNIVKNNRNEKYCTS